MSDATAPSGEGGVGTPTVFGEPRPMEPWLQGTLADVPALLRAVLHALELARQDMDHYCGELTVEELHAQPFGLPSVAFHMRHIARSIDRLLTYTEGNDLDDKQMLALKSESEASAPKAELFLEFHEALRQGEVRIRRVDLTKLEQARKVGRKRLPTTVAGLVIHIADHTQRHVGQAVTTSKLLVGQRQPTCLPSK